MSAQVCEFCEGTFNPGHSCSEGRRVIAQRIREGTVTLPRAVVEQAITLVQRVSIHEHESGCTFSYAHPHMHRGVNCDDAHPCSCGWAEEKATVVAALKEAVK